MRAERGTSTKMIVISAGYGVIFPCIDGVWSVDRLGTEFSSAAHHQVIPKPSCGYCLVVLSAQNMQQRVEVAVDGGIGGA